LQTTQTVDRARKGFTNQQDTIPSNIIPEPSILATNACKLEELGKHLNECYGAELANLAGVSTIASNLTDRYLQLPV
jgi:hypothetical protein